MRTPPTLSDFARICACCGLLAVAGVACLNPITDDFPSGRENDPVGAGGSGTGAVTPPQASAGMSSGGSGGGSFGAGGSAQAGQAGSGSPVNEPVAPDAGSSPDADAGAATEADGGP